MIDPLAHTHAIPQHPASDTGKVLRWQRNERMGGMVPVWEKRSPAQAGVEQTLTRAAQGGARDDFSTALAYAQTAGQPDPYRHAEEFGFGDLVDMVNPLQHVPLVGHLYREVTGDDIRPIAKIIGGTVYGGAMGAAAGLADTIVEYETGQSITGNVVTLATEGRPPSYRSDRADEPQKRLSAAAKGPHENSAALPGTVIGFADLGGRAAKPPVTATRYSYND